MKNHRLEGILGKSTIILGPLTMYEPKVHISFGRSLIKELRHRLTENGLRMEKIACGAQNFSLYPANGPGREIIMDYLQRYYKTHKT